MGKESNSILVVDDEPYVISALVRVLDEEPLVVKGALSAEEGLRLMQAERFKVVISDEKMPGMDGAEFLIRVKELHPETVRMMLTGHASVEAAMRAVNCGEIYRFFSKPWHDAELKLALRNAVEKYDLEQENRRLLQTVRRQSEELGYLERNYPGITEIRRDARGAIDIESALSEEEVAEILAHCSAIDSCKLSASRAGS
jgi:two-component system, probable response regulator PhcQ